MRAVNLLPGQYRRDRPAGEGNSGMILVGVLVALVVMAAVYALTVNQVNSRKSDSAAAAEEARRLEARAGALAPFGDFARVKQTRTASVRELAEVRFDWERLMRELARVVPRGSWLQEAEASTTGQLEGATGGDSGGSGSSGGSSGGATSGAAGGPAARLAGCSPKQSEVAKLMVRLRRLHRVKDVMLNESLREQSSGAASVDNCGRYLKFDVTVVFAPEPPAGPDADGRGRAPASLGGGA